MMTTQLALETTGKTGSIAVLENEQVLWQRQAGTQRRTAAEFAVELQAALQWCEQRTSPPEAISVAVGPGSFTGLRIAVTTAKTLGYALSLPVVPVGSLIAIAAATRLHQTTSRVLVGLNAYRKQVFTAEFSVEELSDATLINSCRFRAQVVDLAEWESRRELAAGDASMVIAADPSISPKDVATETAEGADCDAAGVGRIAAKLMSSVGPSAIGGPSAASRSDLVEPSSLKASNSAELTEDQVFVDPFALATHYLKPSAAEEKAASR